MNIAVGDAIPEWVMQEVSAARMRTMAAILRDPNPVHWDSRVVQKLGLGDHVINQGPLGLSYMVNMLYAWTGPQSIRRLIMRFPQPVLDGDCTIAQGRVTAIRDVAGEQLADCDIWLQREGSKPPLEGQATVLIPTDWLGDSA